ncbi:hypothetical protein PV458_34715 [Streptomyces sp. MN03-5084-2B]|nr:hypothetical protein [Streptomyces sp. MN03-5084-2B]
MNSDDRFEIHNHNQVQDGDIIQQFAPGSIGKQVSAGLGDNPSVAVHGGDYVVGDKTADHRGDVNHDHRQSTET